MTSPSAMYRNPLKPQPETERTTVFFRNDDVRGRLDESLVTLTERMVAAGLPVSHAVEPANVTREVVEWLLKMQGAHPDCVEILQHGLDHRIKTEPPHRGEFGGNRSYDTQLDDIRKGKALMEEFFEDRWTPIFSFPYGSYNHDTLKALEACGFKIISTGVRFTLKRMLLNGVGHLLRVNRVVGKNIVYFNQKRPTYSLYEFPVMINNTKRQTGPDTGVQLSLDEMRNAWKRVPRTLKTRGILCHHRFCTREDIEQLLAFLMELKAQGIRFSPIGNLYEEMDRL